MKIQIDKARCEGHAQCNLWAPEVYPIDAEGYVDVDGDLDIPPGQERAARDGAGACPERAITLLA